MYFSNDTAHNKFRFETLCCLFCRSMPGNIDRVQTGSTKNCRFAVLLATHQRIFFLNTEQIYMTSCVLFSSLYKLNSINSWFVLSVYYIYVCRFSVRANVLIKRGSQTLSAVVSIAISVVPITC